MIHTQRRNPSENLIKWEEKDAEDTYAETESARKLNKMRLFEGQCSQVFDYMFLSGKIVATDRELLFQKGISAVLNCASTHLPCYHQEDVTLTYFRLPLYDLPTERISRYFYEVLSMMETMEKEGQKLLVHCHQGVSRSCTVVIAYIMWKNRQTYDQAFRSLREARAIAQPNVGFICDLIDWDKRRQASLQCSENGGTVGDTAKLYMCFPQENDEHDSWPGTPWLLNQNLDLLKTRQLTATDSSLVVHFGKKVFIWKGAKCSDMIADGAVRHAEYLRKFEGADAWIKASSSDLKPYISSFMG